jgi:penicillin-binding protein 2
MSMFLPPPPPRHDAEPDPLPLALRAAALGVVAAALLGVLGFRLWALQVLHSDQYAVAAVANQLRTTALPAPRGEIVDRNGRVMVSNAYGLTAQINPGTLPHPADCKLVRKARGAQGMKSQPGCLVMWHLAWVLKLKAWDVITQYGKGQTQNHGYPVSIDASVTPQQVRYVKERAGEFRGVQFLQSYQRQYPLGALAPNILGYAGRVSPADLANHHFFGEHLPADGTVGKQGVEYTYDQWLRGVDGQVAQSFDATGNPVGSPYLARAPQTGDTLKLNIDARLQSVAEKSIAYGIQVARAGGQYLANRGAIVAMNPDTGAIYALASWPTYNPSIYIPPYTGSRGILNPKNPLQPTLDKAAIGTYPAGSTFKPFTATAAWKAGLIGPGSTLPCTTSYTSPYDASHHVFNNWGPINLTINLPTALEISCDTFFYRLGDAFYGRYLHDRSNTFQQWLRRFGYGTLPAGFDMFTSTGIVPDHQWKEHYPCFQAGNPNPCKGFLPLSQGGAAIAQNWEPGDSIQLAIGQGYLEVSPLQEAIAYSALANGGRIIAPHVAQAIIDPTTHQVVQTIPPQTIRNLHLSPVFLNEVQTGLYGATHAADGTSSAVFGTYRPGAPFTVYGKTGTAEVPYDCLTCNNAWWSGWATNGHQKLVVVAMIQDGGHGGVAAAPAALRVFEAFFHRKVTAVAGHDVSH